MNVTDAVKERFMSKVTTSETGCWQFSALRSTGYGWFNYDKKQWMAHRFSYSVFVSDIPDRHVIHHKCNNPACVNPDHLESLLPAEHVHRGDTFQAKNKAKTHCPHSHPYDEANTSFLRNGARQCKTCNRNRSRLRGRRLRAEKKGWLTVSCMDCGAKSQQPADALPYWNDRCRACAAKETGSRPEQKVLRSKRGKWIVEKEGGIRNSPRFTPATTKGEKNANWKGGKPQCLDCGKTLSEYNGKRCRECHLSSRKSKR